MVQPNSGIQLELQVRRRIRGLFDKKRAFEGEKRRYELAIRLRDQSFERLFAPPTPVVNARSLLVAACLSNWPRFSSPRTGWRASGPRFGQSGSHFIATWVIFPTATGKASSPIYRPFRGTRAGTARDQSPGPARATTAPLKPPFPAPMTDADSGQRPCPQ